MKIKYHRRFEKQFKKLNPKLKEKTVKVIELFIINPHHKSLHNHSLEGVLKGKNSISVTGDLRIIFEESNKYLLIVFLDIGTHNRVYNK